MPPRRFSKKSKKLSRRRRSSQKKRRGSRKGSTRKVITIVHYHQQRPFQNHSSVYVRRPQPAAPRQARPHHIEYRSGDIHEHLNRVNYAPRHKLSQQDEIQRQLKQHADRYVPNYMQVSSNELAIPAPLKQMQRGMRMFSSA